MSQMTATAVSVYALKMPLPKQQWTNLKPMQPLINIAFIAVPVLKPAPPPGQNFERQSTKG